MTRIQCFLLARTGEDKVSLRRYSSASVCGVSCVGYHDAMFYIGKMPSDGGTEKPDKSDPSWPTHCACGYEFEENDARQVFRESIWERQDTGEEVTLRDAPVGAMWNAYWLNDVKGYIGPDGQSLYVKTPGGDWCIDGIASNCTRREDRVHKCWVRHGDAPNITVDKNGDTCAAGAGSIICGSYHGFLRGGFLESC